MKNNMIHIEYIIVKAPNVDEMEKQVNEKLKQGYEFYGKLIVVEGENKQKYFYKEMARYGVES